MITNQLINCSSATRSSENENIISGCIASFFQNTSGFFSQHTSLTGWNTSGIVGVPIKGQDFFGYDFFKILKRFPRWNVIAVDNLAWAIRSFKKAVSSHNILVNEVCNIKCWNIILKLFWIQVLQLLILNVFWIACPVHNPIIDTACHQFNLHISSLIYNLHSRAIITPYCLLYLLLYYF